MNLKQAILSKSIAFFENGVYAFDNRRLLQDANTEILHEAAIGLWQKIKPTNPTVIVGKGIGSLPLLTAIKLVAYMVDNVSLAILFIRDERKTRGMFKKLIEGPEPKEVGQARAAFVDDIFNKGATYESCKKIVFEEGFNLTFVACAVLFDFWDGSRKLIATGEPFFSLYRRHDLGMTRKDSGIPTFLDSIKWRQHVYHEGRDFMPVKSLPVAHNGKIYVGNDNTNFYCMDANSGDTVWMRASALPSLKGSVCEAQFSNGFVYWSAYDGTLKKADAETGELSWVAKLDLALHSSPVLDQANNRLFIGTEWNKQDWFGQGDIVSVDMGTGSELWRTPTKGMIPASPCYSAAHNMILCGSNDFHVYLLNADTGAIIAKIPTKGEVKGKIAISGDIAIAVTVSGRVYGIDLISLAIIWERRAGVATVHSFPIIEGSQCFVTNTSQVVMAIDVKTGNLNWVTKLRGSVHWGVTSLPVGLLALTENGYVVVLDKLTGSKLASDRITRTTTLQNPICYQPPAYDGESLVIVTNNQGVICFSVDFDKVLA